MPENKKSTMMERLLADFEAVREPLSGLLHYLGARGYADFGLLYRKVLREEGPGRAKELRVLFGRGVELDPNKSTVAVQKQDGVLHGVIVPNRKNDEPVVLISLDHNGGVQYSSLARILHHIAVAPGKTDINIVYRSLLEKMEIDNRVSFGAAYLKPEEQNITQSEIGNGVSSSSPESDNGSGDCFISDEASHDMLTDFSPMALWRAAAAKTVGGARRHKGCRNTEEWARMIAPYLYRRQTEPLRAEWMKSAETISVVLKRVESADAGVDVDDVARVLAICHADYCGESARRIRLLIKACPVPFNQGIVPALR
ncbi:MAG: hypothetical protein KGI37_01235 [Alphaproteobacteria bacterium]|nr:hypothetical protein [Alphaproteobacteria bacterium]